MMAASKKDVVPPRAIYDVIDKEDDGTKTRLPYFFCLYRGSSTGLLLQKYATESDHVRELVYTTAEVDAEGTPMIVGYVQFKTNRTGNGITHRHYPWIGCKFFKSRRLGMKTSEAIRFITGPFGVGLVKRENMYPDVWHLGVNAPEYEGVVLDVGKASVVRRQKKEVLTGAQLAAETIEQDWDTRIGRWAPEDKRELNKIMLKLVEMEIKEGQKIGLCEFMQIFKAKSMEIGAKMAIGRL